ncbi:MAG TPA: acyltransferase family protein [Candidatus Limnocylindria bacterium]
MTVPPQATVQDPIGGSAWDTAVSTESVSHFRPDIEGLRAVAILAVLAFHAGLPGVPGGFVGVDIFFVISGFLITGLLLRELTGTGTIAMGSFYARRARRLLPAALLVIVVTVAVSSLVLSSVRFPDVAADGAAAALYVSNYRYAVIATDYFAAGGQPSPLLHYWSLGVEEQFYLFWPILILLAVRLFGAARLWLVLAAVLVGSFALSVAITWVEAPWAFYSLPTRAWQLALGGLVGLSLPMLDSRLPRPVFSSAAIVGLVLIAVSVVFLDESTPFPGYAALLPAVGCALVILGGQHAGAAPARVLATGPFRWFGRISYSLYLWHWPVLILGPIILGISGLPARVALALLAIGIAALSTRYVETPIRFGTWPRTANSTLVASGAASIVIFGAAVLASTSMSQAHAQAPLPILGSEGSTRPTLPRPKLAGPIPADLTPSLIAAKDDRGDLREDSCESKVLESTVHDCIYGAADSPTTVVVLGDSHASMWVPAIQAIGEQRDWRIVAMLKPACSPVMLTVWDRSLKRPFTECDTWRGDALARIQQLQPSIVFVTSSRTYDIVDADGRRQRSNIATPWRAAMVKLLQTLKDNSERVVLIGEIPRLEGDPVECLASSGRLEACDASRSQVVSENYQAIERRAAAVSGVNLVEPVDWLCQSSCALVLDRYLVYRGRGHITATAALLLAPQLRWELDHSR